jgi:hypothetical protein
MQILAMLFLEVKGGLCLSPLFVADSGAPFNITVGQDLYGTTLFNGRPGIATDSTRPGLVQTRYGLLDPNPRADESILNRNYGRGPGIFMLNLRASEVFSFGPAAGRFPRVAVEQTQVHSEGVKDRVSSKRDTGSALRCRCRFGTC